MPSRSDAARSGAGVSGALNQLARGLNSRALLAAIVLFGAVLRIYNYAANRSLWLDEAALAHNIIQRSFAQLTAPLDFAQIAPVGFLWIEKAAVLRLGTSEYALRLVPLLASLAALVLFALVARRVLSGLAVPFAVFLFATAPQLIYFASETKQYSLDTAGALAIFAMALAARGHVLSTRRALGFGIVGGLLPWFTQPSVFVLGAAALYLLVMPPRARRVRVWQSSLPIILPWAIGATLAIRHALHSIAPGDAAYLRTFWNPAFLPAQSGLTPSMGWIADLARGAFEWHFAPRLPWVALALFVLGGAFFALRKRGMLILILGPIVLALCASALHVYPVFARLTLFVAPSLFLTVGAGAELLLEASGARVIPRVATIGALGLIALFSLATARYLPILREELRPVARYVARHRKPGDTIYVYYGAAQAFLYYAPRVGIPDSAYIIGTCARDDWRNYTAQLDSLRGRPRVWLVLTHAFVRGGIRENTLFTTYLSRLGRPLEGLTTHGALGELYDLSAPPRDTTATYVAPRSGNDSGDREKCFGTVGR